MEYFNSTKMLITSLKWPSFLNFLQCFKVNAFAIDNDVDNHNGSTINMSAKNDNKIAQVSFCSSFSLPLSLIELNSSVNEFIIKCYTKLNFRKCWLLFNLRLDLSCVVVFFICLPIGMSLIIVPRLKSPRKKGNTNDFDRFFFISSCASIQCVVYFKS